MTYATLADFQKVFPLEEGEEINTAQLEQCLLDATAEVDAYVGQTYALPLENPPPILKRITLDIAHYLLATETLGETESKRQRYEDRIQFLKSLAKGEVALGGNLPAKKADVPKKKSVYAFQSTPRVFKR